MGTVKVRVPNFTNSEKGHLMSIIANKYARIIEDKKTDRVSSTQKEQAWKAIENEFNASCSTNIYRNAASLKKCYENRKKELRKTLAEEKKQFLLTGGGPPPKMKNESDDILRSIINEKTLTGHHNRFDDDADLSIIEVMQENNDREIEYVFEPENRTQTLQSITNVTNVADCEETIPMRHTKIINAENSMETNLREDDVRTWKKYSPDKLQSPISAPLRPANIQSTKNMLSDSYKTPRKRTRRRPTTIIKPMASSDIAKKYDLLLDKRLQLIEGQLNHMETENKLIIKKRQIEIQILELELEKDKQILQNF